MNMTSQLGYILTPFRREFILLLIGKKNEETLTVCKVALYSSKLNKF